MLSSMLHVQPAPPGSSSAAVTLLFGLSAGVPPAAVGTCCWPPGLIKQTKYVAAAEARRIANSVAGGRYHQMDR